MRKDEAQTRFFSDEQRFADLINGAACEGKQIVLPEDVSVEDTQSGVWQPSEQIKEKKKRRNKKQRDILKRVALGVNFIVIGIENQDEVHYLMPVRTMGYDVAEYERQAAVIRKKLKEEKGLSPAEFLSGFRKTWKLRPCVTFVLFYGREWDGSKDLHELLDFTDIPEELRKYVNNYSVHLINVRKLNTNVFKSDVKLVFDFIRFSEDKVKLMELVNGNEEYKRMAEDAYDMAALYTNTEGLIEVKNYSMEGEKIDMCSAIKEMCEDSRMEGREKGREEGREEGIRELILDNIEENIPIERIHEKLIRRFKLSAEAASEFIDKTLGTPAVN